MFAYYLYQHTRQQLDVSLERIIVKTTTRALHPTICVRESCSAALRRRRKIAVRYYVTFFFTREKKTTIGYQ